MASIVEQLREKHRQLGRKIREAEAASGHGGYARHKESTAAAQRAQSQAGRDIGPLPAVVNPERRERCEHDDELFLRTYFPNRFYLPFCDAHRDAIRSIARCMRVGGLSIAAMPRGFGKDTITEGLAIKALVYGFRRFAVVVQATERHAAKSLRRIEREFETNDLLLEDFPEVCYPIRCLERINQRAKGQTLDGEPTLIEFSAEGIVLPTVRGSRCSGSAVQVYGLTGAIRGLVITSPTGEPIRPDLVIINDAQTRESAKSPIQTNDREAMISDDVLMLAGPTTTIAAVMLGTVIYRNDLTDRHLDSELHPEWSSVRTKMLLSFPERMDLWDEYAETRRQGMREGDEGKRGTVFYATNRVEMDKGGKVSWPERFKAGELSGLQSAMNIYYDNPRGFWSECQNDPQAEALAEGAKDLSAPLIVRRVSGLERFTVPRECTRLTAFIDPGLSVLWYLIAAWTERGGGSIIDYGCFPRQNRTFFEARDARPTLGQTFTGMSESQLVFAGLDRLTEQILSRSYPHETGGEMSIERLLIDCGWQSEAVFQFIRQSKYASIIYPSKGIGRTLTTTGVSEWKKRPGERVGPFWRLTVPESGRVRMLQFDPDYWKSKLHELLTKPLGDGASLTLYGQLRKVDHEMIGAHLASEFSAPVTVRGSTFDKWQLRPEGNDNHLFDCAVGAAIAASVQGLVWSASGEPIAPKPKGKTLAEMQAEARRQHGGSAPSYRR